MTDEKSIEKFTIELCIGDKIEVGRFHMANQTITAIEVDKWGHPVVTTNSGRKFPMIAKRLKKLIPEDVKRMVPLTDYKEVEKQ